MVQRGKEEIRNSRPFLSGYLSLGILIALLELSILNVTPNPL
jgi:hypothetical protein